MVFMMIPNNDFQSLAYLEIPGLTSVFTRAKASSYGGVTALGFASRHFSLMFCGFGNTVSPFQGRRLPNYMLRM
jgi:hypothetical protein